MEQCERHSSTLFGSNPARRQAASKVRRLDTMEMAPREFDAYVRREIALNLALARRAGLKPE